MKYPLSLSKTAQKLISFIDLHFSEYNKKKSNQKKPTVFIITEPEIRDVRIGKQKTGVMFLYELRTYLDNYYAKKDINLYVTVHAGTDSIFVTQA